MQNSKHKYVDFIVLLYALGSMFFCVYAITMRSSRELPAASSGAHVSPSPDREVHRGNLHPVIPTDRSKQAEVLESVIAASPRGPADMPWVQAEKLFGAFPELKAAFVKGQKARIQIGYGPFFRNYSVSSDIAQKVVTILARTEEEWAQNQADMADGTIKLEEERERWRRSRERRDAELKSTLGAEYARFTDYQQSIQVLESIVGPRSFATALLGTEEALSSSAYDDIVELCSRSMVFSPSAVSQASGVTMESLSSAASSLLRPKQMEIFQTFLDAWQIQLAQNRLSNAQSGGNK